MDEILPENTEVVINDGVFKGFLGSVISYDHIADEYLVYLPEIEDQMSFHYLAVFALDEEEEDEQPTPEFGMSADEFAAHLEYLVVRTLDRVPTAGAQDAFFGFQEFEGQTVDETLTLLLEKIEDGFAHLAQLHILVSRIGLAYRQITDGIKNDSD